MPLNNSVPYLNRDLFQGYELPEDPVVLTAMAQNPSRQRSKNFTQHDKDLALRLLIEHDPKNILASHKWKPEVKAQKQFILSSIHKAFTQEADRKEVTLLQVCSHKQIPMYRGGLKYGSQVL